MLQLFSICTRRVTVSEPFGQIKDDIKVILENSTKNSVVIKNLVSIEDYGYPPALGSRKGFQLSPDRKIEISGSFQLPSQIDKMLSQFLTLTESRRSNYQPKPPKISINEEAYLSRACLEIHRKVSTQPITLYIYYDPIEATSPGISSHFSAFDTMTVEEEITTKIETMELENYKIQGTALSVSLRNNDFMLRAAKVKQLMHLPEANSSITSALKNFYCLEMNNFYASRNETVYLRPLTQIEISELVKLYLKPDAQLELRKEAFPDQNKSSDKLKYEYVVIKDSIYLSSGTYSKNWLVQIKPSPSKITNANPSLKNHCR